MATSDGRDYFQRTRLFWMVTLSVALIYFACTVFAPDVVPFELLGPFGTFSKNFAYNHPDLLYKGDTARFIMDMRKFFQKQEPHSVQRGERGKRGT
ncbi:transmembrane protein 254-like [Oreochromis aureus]|uniref:transmembrane protein 254-like n=1 Tax=Oreochromis aureus TaxID=47969 RepID=UPI0019534C03|nr:transmembrane protein 254-like [Oreochromis aureus]